MTFKNVFNEQQHLINHFFENLDHSEVEQFSQRILACKGLIFLTGMGKSGIIAKNISQMLVSTGVRAMFLDPVNALHGDVGVITEQDIVVLFSRSGQTAELLNLLPAIRNKKAFMIAVVSNRDGLLAKQCHETVYLPLEKELCPFDMAPTTSSIIQLIFGNTVVASLMQQTGLTKEQYAMNHPAGRIGKRLTVRVEDVMRPLKDIAICKATDRLLDQIPNMTEKSCGILLVEDNTGKLLGVFTDGDLRRAIQKSTDSLTMPMEELMTSNPSTTMTGIMAFEAMQEMERHDPNQTTCKKRVKELPVIDTSGKIEGLLTLHDLVRFGL